MADEEKNETTEQKDEQAEEQPQAEAPEDAEPSPDAPAAEAEDVTEDAEPSPDAPAGEGEVAVDEALEGLDWKAQRRLLRSRESGAAAPQRSTDERAAERARRRAADAKGRGSYRRKSRQKQQAGEGTPAAEPRSAGRKMRQGRVVSDKSDKTITVRIDTARRHPTYEKIVRQSSTLRAHDEQNDAGEGDLVRIVETRPLSRTKRWRLVDVLERAK